MTGTTPTQERIKHKAITELFNSKQLQKKLEGIMERHNLPTQAGIQDDILQTTFEHLSKYPTNKIVEMYKDNPTRLVGLGMKIMIKEGVLADLRSPAGYRYKTASNILHLSNLGTYRTANNNEEGKYINNNNHHINPSNTLDDDDYESVSLKYDDEDEKEEEINQQMWIYVRNHLTPLEEETLDYALVLPSSKMRKQLKKDYFKLLPKLKELITTFKKYN